MYIPIILIMTSFIFSYGIGDQVSTNDQNLEFDVCAGSHDSDVLRLADFNGATNGGNYHILFIDISASW